MSDHTMTDDEKELARLVREYAISYELGFTGGELREDMDRILTHYRKAKLTR